MLPNQDSVPVFVQIRKAPRLDLNRHPEWRARPYAELHATNDRKNKIIDVMSVACPRGFSTVLKGETFDIWEPDTGTYYGYANPKVRLPELQRRRKEGFGRANSPFFEFKREATRASPGTTATLPCMYPRIAFRDVTRASDTRTARAPWCRQRSSWPTPPPTSSGRVGMSETRNLCWASCRVAAWTGTCADLSRSPELQCSEPASSPTPATDQRALATDRRTRRAVGLCQQHLYGLRYSRRG